MRIFFLGLLALLGHAACAHHPPAPPAPQPTAVIEAKQAEAEESPLVRDFPWDTCKGELQDKTQRVTCKDIVFTRTLVHGNPKLRGDLLIDSTLASLRRGAETYGKAVDRHLEADLNGERGRGYGMQLQIPKPEGPPRSFPFVTYAEKRSPTRVIGVACIDLAEKTTDRCVQLSHWFASHDPQVEWVDKRKPPTFAGRTLRAPPGCTIEPGAISCDDTDAEFIWWTRDARHPKEFESEPKTVYKGVLEINQHQTGFPPKVESHKVNCKLDGELAKCTVDYISFGRARLFVVRGGGKLRGYPTQIMCDWPTKHWPTKLRKPCSNLIDLKLPK